VQGIQSLIDSGVKESEISYQLQFSKQNLKQLLSLYTTKEVKKVCAGNSRVYSVLNNPSSGKYQQPFF
jgi:hypothetical protein